jgi:5'(3')-deoxyribonucleotidase
MDRKIIAIDLDDTLNDFSETLKQASFPRGPSPLSEERFASYLHKIKSNLPDESDLLSTEYSHLRYQVHKECYRQARARPDGVAFMQWLKQKGWQIIICTYRDLRRANDSTREWLFANRIPFDHLFMAGNKIVFCKAWGIPHLIDDDEFNIVHGGLYGVNVFYPLMNRHKGLPPNKAKGFTSFEEVKPWIQE